MANGTEQVDDTMIAVVDSIKEHMEVVLTSTMLDHNESRHLVDSAKDNIASRDTHVDLAFDVVSAGEHHDQCRAVEAELHRNLTEVFDKYLTLLAWWHGRAAVRQCTSKKYLKMALGGSFNRLA